MLAFGAVSKGSAEKLVELVVRADPEPNDGVTFSFCQGAEGVVDAD